MWIVRRLATSSSDSHSILAPGEIKTASQFTDGFWGGGAIVIDDCTIALYFSIEFIHFNLIDYGFFFLSDVKAEPTFRFRPILIIKFSE